MLTTLSPSSISRQSPAAYFLSLPLAERQRRLAALTPIETASLEWNWQHFWSRPEQRIPEWDWQVWLILAGRGFDFGVVFVQRLTQAIQFLK